MKKFLILCSVLFISASVISQEIEHDGFVYEIPKSAVDSTVTFYPVDKAKLSAIINDDDYVECPVPGYAGHTVSFYVGNKRIKQEANAYVNVMDTLYSQEDLKKKHEYIEFRLRVLNAIREQIAAIKSQGHKKLTDERQRSVYNSVMKNYGGKEGEKDWTKYKVGKYFLSVFPLYEELLTTEEKSLKQVMSIKDTIKFLGSPVLSGGAVGLESRNMAESLGITVPENYLLNKKYIDEARRFGVSVLTIEKKQKSVSFKNPILSDTPMTVRNPNYQGVGFLEWQWLQSMSEYPERTNLEHVQTSFPVEADYYRSDKYADYEFYRTEWPISHGGWFVCDKSGELIGVQYNRFEEDSVVKAVMFYEYEHNAYNIQQEKKDVQKWAKYLINKRGYHEANAYDWAYVGVLISAGSLLEEERKARNAYAYHRITKAEYNKRIADLKKRAAKIKQTANKVAQKLPSVEDQNRAEKYVKQLESDTYHKYSNMNVERLNGTQMMLVSKDGRVKVLLTYVLEKNKKLNWTYDVIEKK